MSMTPDEAIGRLNQLIEAVRKLPEGAAIGHVDAWGHCEPTIAMSEDSANQVFAGRADATRRPYTSYADRIRLTVDGVRYEWDTAPKIVARRNTEPYVVPVAEAACDVEAGK